MPAELFRSDLPATPIRHRASVLPVSIVAHVVAIARVIIPTRIEVHIHLREKSRSTARCPD